MPILVYREFGYPGLTNQTQSYYAAVTNKMQLYSMTYMFMVQGRGHSNPLAIVMAVVIIFSDKLREKRSLPLTN